MTEIQTFPVTTFELTALLALAPSPAAMRTAAVLRLPDPGSDAVAKRAGLASLLVRNLATADSERVAPAGEAGVIAGILTSAVRWIEVGIARSTTADATVLVSAEAATLMITPAGFDVWNILAVAPQTDLIKAALDLAARGIEVTPAGQLVAITVKTSTMQESHTASARRDKTGVWQTALEPADANGQLTIQPETTTDQAAALAIIDKALR